MKKVLLISTKVFHYRVSVYNYLWKRFVEQDWEFIVASNAIQLENQQPLKFKFHQIPFSFGQYRRLIEETKPDVVIFHMHIKDVIFWLLFHWLKLRRMPVVCWTKGANLDDPDSLLRYHVFNHFHGLSKAILLYSANELRYIKPPYRSKVFVANNTVNFEDFPSIPDSKEQIRSEFKIPFKKMVLFVGTMGVGGERKKVEHLITVFRNTERNDVGLLLVGGGMSDELKAKLNPRNTQYLGQVHDAANVQISKLFKVADIFVVPGHVGLGINQAFYWGLPVITEAGLQPPEIQYLVNGRNGYIVPENDIRGLGEKIYQLIDNDELREQFARHAREDIHRKASISDMFESFHQAVLRATGQTRPSTSA